LTERRALFYCNALFKVSGSNNFFAFEGDELTLIEGLIFSSFVSAKLSNEFDGKCPTKNP
jgi:hypothetical protein